MNLQEQVKLRSEQLEQIYDKLNKGILKDCLEIRGNKIFLKTYSQIIVRVNENGKFDNEFYNAYAYAAIDATQVFVRFDEPLTFDEIMDSIIVEEEKPAWTLDWAKQQIVEQFEWLRLEEDGKITRGGNLNEKFVGSDGDVNWRIRKVDWHPIFEFDAGDNVFLTKDNYEKYIEFLKEYEEKALNMKWSWEE